MENKEKNTDLNLLTAEMYQLIEKQNTSETYSYAFSDFQEKRYRLSEKIEENLPEEKRLALYIQNKLYKTVPHEALQWMEESPNLVHNWDGELHKKYLRKAEQLLHFTAYNKIIKMLDIMWK